MADNIEFITLGPEETANKVAECVPITHKNISTTNRFQEYLANLSRFMFIAVILFNPTEQVRNAILFETEKRKDQIIGIFICCNSLDRLTSDSIKIYFVSELLIPYKLTPTIPRFLELECIKQLKLGNIDFSQALEQQRKKIIQRSSINDKIHGCHILLIPLNASRKYLERAKQDLKNRLYNLYGNEYEFIIHTLFDYIPEDESNPDDRSYTAYLEKRYKGDVCHTLMRLSFIRMYVVGNEPYISNKWSQKLVAAELDINQPHTLKYVDRCTFIISKPVSNRFQQDLVPMFGSAWQIQRAIPTTLDDVSNDIEFQDILPRIHGCLKKREMMVNIELHQRSLAKSEDCTIFSSESHIIQSAINCPEEKQAVGDISKLILS